MKAPKIPSFFKASRAKSFSFKPRYYDERKERRKQLQEGTIANIRFKRGYTQKEQKGRSMKIVFLIIILSLLAYKVIIN